MFCEYLVEKYIEYKHLHNSQIIDQRGGEREREEKLQEKKKKKKKNIC